MLTAGKADDYRMARPACDVGGLTDSRLDNTAATKHSGHTLDCCPFTGRLPAAARRQSTGTSANKSQYRCPEDSVWCCIGFVGCVDACHTRTRSHYPAHGTVDRPLPRQTSAAALCCQPGNCIQLAKLDAQALRKATVATPSSREALTSQNTRVTGLMFLE